jgi:hypothetical protein
VFGIISIWVVIESVGLNKIFQRTLSSAKGRDYISQNPGEHQKKILVLFFLLVV